MQAFIAASDAVIFTQRRQIADLALRNRLPSMFSQREYAEAGGLMSYGENLSEFFRRAASFLDKIFKGAKPGDLPIEQPTRRCPYSRELTTNFSPAAYSSTQDALCMAPCSQ